MPYRFWHIEFDAVHPLEFDGFTVIAAETEPTEDEANELICVHGSIYLEKITEISESDMRFVTPKRVIYPKG